MAGDSEQLKAKDKLLLVGAAVGFGVLTWLEAYGITDLARGRGDTPRWVMLLMGSMFIAAGLAMLFRIRGRLNDLFAFAIITSMAVVFGWIALYSDDGGFSGGGALASRLTGLPIDRAIFGLGSVLCFGAAAYALRRALRR